MGPCGATPGCQGTRRRFGKFKQCTECHESWKGSKTYRPIRVEDGSDGAMMQRLRDVRAKGNITLYRVEHRAQQPKFGGPSKPAPKPKAEGGWKYTMCESQNKPAAKTCSKCTYDPSKNSGFGQGGYSEEQKTAEVSEVKGQWICTSYTNNGTVCEVKNKPTSMKCSSCTSGINPS